MLDTATEASIHIHLNLYHMDVGLNRDLLNVVIRNAFRLLNYRYEGKEERCG